MHILENYSLKTLNTFEIDAQARYFVEVQTAQMACEALDFALQENLSIFVLGGGSNILLSDAGFDGLVIQNKIKDLRLKIQDGIIKVGAGENWDDVAALAVESNLQGIECLSGVPGTAGGAVVQNIGAYGQTVGDRVVKVEGLRIKDGKKEVFDAAACEFEYRSSHFKKNPGKFIVTSLELELNSGAAPFIAYQDLQRRFEGQKPTLAEARKAVIEIRASKGYVIMPGYECYKTAGSFFKNPVVSREKFQDLRFKIKDVDNWFWEMPGSRVKVAAAKLLQEAGFPKGYQAGRVGISPKHSLSLVNLDEAKASEVRALADMIKTNVFGKFGINLKEEVLFVGEFD
ncbi:MAG: UDP-N-acetylenolpyruvoylglucosamine reductase [Candidatus Doudnabacteria bacterium RIFCSPLOWO2_02_FULL_48_8]|uniref:UDP-N-acetylenolpyruvoylglucosamine reductase n=1 Tax=Candidatus Doudnabacteria bacterium RIFCSPHIGHO2_01_FULL_46_24 TaxID=1817825 RepID=A0A1F5NU18_9BACT|nr:MAG: UDP-N-acetylenolpyruvoylglucosamine reductase [Candidatus Doudnabacteria bacterium RIFCSPHIGHO2_01_FULL_46_24]OGE95747.1 MAG: UDP-N-acetylenolpyruvoylglucosamine reductase [Candidatus Doudnabacteria bacterium RIFCSPLOWO2_02_FULL_48_8]OGE96057.1 MAG: UDP-N-acetylenolpyruvoylglucosamine reductase [Candidatus Doudnabacteria bacterium RIFCSPHIGHO2_12_FULL_48_11]